MIPDIETVKKLADALDVSVSELLEDPREDTKSIVDGYKEHFVLVIYKCIIPKGSLYYSGKFRKYESYCSNNIKLIEVCV